MLELKATGDTHPRTFTLKTDDEDAELAAMSEALEAWEVEDWTATCTADQFAAGVVVPVEFVSDGGLGDLMEECDFTQAIEECDRVRREYEAEIEAKMVGHEATDYEVRPEAAE